MSEITKLLAEWFTSGLELVGIIVISIFSLSSLWAGFREYKSTLQPVAVFKKVRQKLAHGILLGLEFLVAADIIHTVAVDLSFHTVGTLAVIVLIRTFLSFTIELELSGNWPWQSKVSPHSSQ